jgi:hypothetical protein
VLTGHGDLDPKAFKPVSVQLVVLHQEICARLQYNSEISLRCEVKTCQFCSDI